MFHDAVDVSRGDPEQAQDQSSDWLCFVPVGFAEHARAHRLQGRAKHGVDGSRADNDIEQLRLDTVADRLANDRANASAEVGAKCCKRDEGRRRGRIGIRHLEELEDSDCDTSAGVVLDVVQCVASDFNPVREIIGLGVE
jgi:hypothetical protein